MTIEFHLYIESSELLFPFVHFILIPYTRAAKSPLVNVRKTKS